MKVINYQKLFLIPKVNTNSLPLLRDFNQLKIQCQKLHKGLYTMDFKGELKGKNNMSLAKPLYAKDLDESYCIIDIRYPEDYALCHIKDSLQLNNPYDVYAHIKKNKDKKCVLVCYSGHTASILGTELVQEGLENVYFYDDEFSSLAQAKIQLITQ